jgi:probable HAF family extracellular repeat protein
MSIAYITLDFPNATQITRAYDINDQEQIVGYWHDSSNNSHAFIYKDTWTSFDEPNGAGTHTTAYGINSAGQIVGAYTDSSGNEIGYLRTGNSFTTLIDPSAGGPTLVSKAYGINASGQVSGYFQDSSGITHGFLYSGGMWTTLNDPSADNSTVGRGTFALGINDAGTVVGYYIDVNGHYHGFTRDSGGNYSDLNNPSVAGGPGTIAYRITNNGQIVGYYADAASRNHGYVYNVSTQTYTTFDDPLGTQTLAQGINSAGQIVGWFSDRNGQTHAFWTVPTADWMIGTNGDFASAANWNPGQVPGSTLGAAISAGGTYTVTSSANEDIESLSTAAGATLNITAGTFTVEYGTGAAGNAGTIVVRAGASLVFENATVYNPGMIEALGGSISVSAELATGFLLVGSGGTINTTGNNYVVHGAGGSELVMGTGDLNQAFADSGNAELYFTGNQNQLFGGSMSDWLGVSGANNALVGGAGNDFIGATGNSNTLVAGSGNSTLFAAGTGNVLYAGSGQDWQGVSGNQNQIFGGPGSDFLGVTGVNNAISGGSGNSTLFANGTSNTLSGGSGNDFIGVSGNGNNLYGGSGNSYLAATGSFNTLDPGGASNDILFAAANGHDHDTFVFRPGDRGQDTAFNFVPQIGDQVDLRGWGLANVQQLSPYVGHSADGSIMLSLGGGTLTLEGIAGDLQNSWFKFS